MSKEKKEGNIQSELASLRRDRDLQIFIGESSSKIFFQGARILRRPLFVEFEDSKGRLFNGNFSMRIFIGEFLLES